MPLERLPRRQRRLSCCIAVGLVFGCAAETVRGQTANPYGSDYRVPTNAQILETVPSFPRQNAELGRHFNQFGRPFNRFHSAPEQTLPAGDRFARPLPATGSVSNNDYRAPSNFQTLVPDQRPARLSEQVPEAYDQHGRRFKQVLPQPGPDRFARRSVRLPAEKAERQSISNSSVTGRNDIPSPIVQASANSQRPIPPTDQMGGSRTQNAQPSGFIPPQSEQIGRPLDSGRFNSEQSERPFPSGAVVAHVYHVEQETPTTAQTANIDVAIRATIRTSKFRTETLTREAMTLAAKGATYSANAKLIEVLESVASQLDDSEGTARHNAALSAGLTALRESEDFSSDSSWQRSKTVRSWTSLGHATPVLRDYSSDRLSRIDAIELYYSYASRQLAVAVAGSSAGSTALCYLGKLQPTLRHSSDQKPQLLAARMVAMHRAAMKADAGNYRAANELGVILANNGQLGAAREQFLTSAEIYKRPENLRNLGVVLEKMGSTSESEKILQLASHQAKDDSARFGDGTGRETTPLVYQVNQQEFAARSNETLPPLSTTPLPASTKPESSSPVATESAAPSQMTERGSRWWNWGRWNMFSSRPVQQASYESELAEVEEAEEISSVVPIVVDHPRNLSCTPEYELRVDDQVGFVFRLNGKPSLMPYRLNVGDTIRVSSLTEEKLLIDTVVQPDGMIVLPQIGTVAAAGNTIDAVQRELEERYTKYIKEPSIAVTPVTINKTVEELRNSIVNRTGNLVNMNGQIFNSTVAPDGEIQLPAIGSVPASGLTLNELRTEIELRYAEIGSGIEVTPVLQKRAPRNIYVMGEVQKPGRYDLAGPTTVMQAIAMAGGWNKGGNVWEVVVFRRDDNYRLMATRVNIYPGLYNAPELGPCDVWLRDTDLVIVPKLKIQVWDDWIEMVFTRGIYGVVPFNGITFSFFKDLSTLGALN